MKSIFSFASILIITLFFSSCDKSTTAPAPLNSVTFPDLNADYAPLVFGSNPAIPPTRPAEKKKYTLFSFKTGGIVVNADSATNKWDIGFQATSIIFNSGTSGPGMTQGQILSGIFSEIVTAPLDGYTSDNKTTNTFVISARALTAGAATTNQWWQNSGAANSTVVSPIAGRVILIKTAEGRYAKMEILSYYKGAPVAPNNATDLDRHYTFRYVYQPAASTSLK